MMVSLVLRRLLGALPTLAVVLALSFALVRLTPGSPFSSERAVAPAVRAALAAKYGLDRPLWQQFGAYVGGLARGDLGPSIKYPEHSVAELIGAALPHSLLLAAGALVWGGLCGGLLGLGAALWPGGLLDGAVRLFSAVLLGLPSFVLAPLLVYGLSVRLNWAPPAGWGTARHLWLPAMTLGTLLAAALARLLRGSLLALWPEDFVRTARAKGLSRRQIVLGHLLRPALVPVVTYLAPAVGGLMVGSVAVERIFCVPGLGPYFVDAAQNRDYFLVMGIVLLEASILLGVNVLADVACALLDPRMAARDN